MNILPYLNLTAIAAALDIQSRTLRAAVTAYQQRGTISPTLRAAFAFIEQLQPPRAEHLPDLPRSVAGAIEADPVEMEFLKSYLATRYGASRERLDELDAAWEQVANAWAEGGDDDGHTEDDLKRAQDAFWAYVYSFLNS